MLKGLDHLVVAVRDLDGAQDLGAAVGLDSDGVHGVSVRRNVLRCSTDPMPRLRKLSRRETVLVALTAVVVVAAVAWWLRSPTGLPLARGRAAGDAAAQPIPRIDLARLDQPRATADAGRRNLFDFGAAPEPEPAPPPVAPPTPPPNRPGATNGTSEGPGGTVVSGPAPLPPLNVKYIGSVENASGVKVAVLVTDRQEVLTGQQGQVVANRYRIAKIGLESVDLEDIATGQSRRVALRGS